MRTSCSTLWIACVVLLLGATARADPPGALQRQRAALQLVSIHDASGRPLDLHRPPGRLLFVDFWAFWCPNCIREMQGLEQLQQQLGPDRIQIVLVSSRADWPRDQAYAAAHALPFPLYVYEPAPVTVQAAALKGQIVGTATRIMLPMTAIFLPNGQLLDSPVGAHNWASPPLVDSLRTLSTMR